jgi:3-oxoacyl-[acyl-carrier protein] reductase
LKSDDLAYQVAETCKALGGDGLAIRADVNSQAEVQAMIDQAMIGAGKIDVVVNNAFLAYAFDPDDRRLFWNLEWNDYQAQLEGSLRSTYNVCKSVIPEFNKQARGSIINIATDLVERPSVPYHEYTTAKSALIAFSRNLAVELGPMGIRVNCVAPGLVYPTDASRRTKQGVLETIIAQTPLRRVAAPEDVTGPVMFLASDWSRFMTGQTLYVDGGLVMR